MENAGRALAQPRIAEPAESDLLTTCLKCRPEIMKRFREIDTHPEIARGQSVRMASVDALASELETNGLVVLPPLLSADQLREMQEAFAARLRRLRWNNFDGYQRTEIYRHMVEDVLLLAARLR